MVVNAAMHFGLPPAPPLLVFVLRRTRTALLIDGIEKERTSMTTIASDSLAFCHENANGYRPPPHWDQNRRAGVKPTDF